MDKQNLISKCADRAVELYPYCKKIDFVMDLEGCIEGGCDLDLEGLLNANEVDFRHDICGIANYLHPRTKKLLDGFLPRFAKKSHKLCQRNQD